MELITKTVAKTLPALGATSEKSAERIKVPLKLFNPCGSQTWFIVEYDPSEDLAFGWADLGMGCPELGYISIAELRAVKVPPFGLGIERDIHWDNSTTLREVMDGKKR